MNSVLEKLLEIVEENPLPDSYTSSFWHHHGQLTVVERRGNKLNLRSSGFESVDRMSLPWRVLCVFERSSYKSVTAQWKSYPKVWRIAQRLAYDLTGGPHYNFNVFKSACALAVLADHWTKYRISPKTFALIGDGYGFLGALVRRYLPHATLYCIDLPKMLVFQARTHELADNKATMSVLTPYRASPAADIVFVAPQEIEHISDAIDCALNIASMQEMNTFAIASYFAFLRRRSVPHSHFYCVNRLRKELPGGEITRFSDYPWSADDEVFLKGLCPYYRYFFSPRMLPNGPRLLGFRIPLVNYFDGPHVHQLVHLAGSS